MARQRHRVNFAACDITTPLREMISSSSLSRGSLCITCICTCICVHTCRSQSLSASRTGATTSETAASTRVSANPQGVASRRENASSRRKKRERQLHDSSARLRVKVHSVNCVAAVKRRIEIFPANSHSRPGESAPRRVFRRRFPRDRCRACMHARVRMCVCVCAYMARRTAHARSRLHASAEATRVNEFAAEANFLRELSSRRRASPPPRRRFPCSRRATEDSDDNFKYLKIRAFHLVGFHSILGCLSARNTRVSPVPTPPEFPRQPVLSPRERERETKGAFVNDADRRRRFPTGCSLCFPRRHVQIDAGWKSTKPRRRRVFVSFVESTRAQYFTLA